LQQSHESSISGSRFTQLTEVLGNSVDDENVTGQISNRFLDEKQEI
jgi:hypothetical protein